MIILCTMIYIIPMVYYNWHSHKFVSNQTKANLKTITTMIAKTQRLSESWNFFLVCKVQSLLNSLNAAECGFDRFFSPYASQSNIAISTRVRNRFYERVWIPRDYRFRFTRLLFLEEAVWRNYYRYDKILTLHL